MFRWILDTLLSIDAIRQVVINTDAREALRANGLEESDRILIRDRRPEICGDLVSMNRILADDIESVTADHCLMTHVTNPLLSKETVERAIEVFREANDNDSLFSVTRHQTRFYRGDGSPINHDPGNLVRTQDLEPWYEENSCLYLFTRDSFEQTNARIGTSPILYATPKLESVDIDEPEDWVMVEALLARVQEASAAG